MTIVDGIKKLITKFGGDPAESNDIAENLDNLGDCDLGSDWNASEGEAGYVQNRTHYEAVETVNEPLNITWDGNTEGLECVADALYKVSDLVFTDEEIKLMTITTSAEGIGPVPISEMWDAMVAQGLATEDYVICTAVVFVRTPNVSVGGITYDVGIYFMNDPEYYYVSSLTTTEPVEQTKTVVHKLDKKYLPDDVGGVFKVNVSYDSTNSAWVCDKTYAEITAAEEAKTPIIGTFTDSYNSVFTLIGCDESDMGICRLAAFDISSRAPAIYSIKVWEDGSVNISQLLLTATSTELT